MYEKLVPFWNLLLLKMFEHECNLVRVATKSRGDGGNKLLFYTLACKNYEIRNIILAYDILRRINPAKN